MYAGLRGGYFQTPVYKESIAKVTLEILDPKVLQIKKDVSATFTDRLGVVGMYKRVFCE